MSEPTPGRVRWPRPKRCQADNGGKHRWEYAKDRTRRECRKCGAGQVPKQSNDSSSQEADRG
jgi:hypothetical protein